MTTTPINGAVMVTGAASGIGRAVATLLAGRGIPLLLVDRDAGGLRTMESSLRNVDVLTATADVTDESGLELAVRETRAERKPLAGLVTCAGIEVVGPILGLASTDWAQCINVNLSGTFYSLRAALPELAETRGAAVFISSDAGVAGAPDYAAYCAAKHGVVGLMRSAALELAPQGIRVNSVAPGFVDTPMAKRIFAGDPAGMRAYARSLPLGRFAQPEEVAKVTHHLLSDEASYTSGCVYMVDGAANTGYFEPVEGVRPTGRAG